MPGSLISKFKRHLFRKKIQQFTTSPEYWEKRYNLGGNSGKGSYGEEAQFKADFINDFLKDSNIKKVIDFGCGDGNNIGLIDYPEYLGIDVSKTAISICKKKFSDNNNYNFFWNDTSDPRPVKQKLNNENYKTDEFDLAQSLDVIFHLIENEIFEAYLSDLFSLSSKYVLIYSSDHEEQGAQHVHHRKVSDYIASHFSDFKLIDRSEYAQGGKTFLVYAKEASIT